MFQQIACAWFSFSLAVEQQIVYVNTVFLFSFLTFWRDATIKKTKCYKKTASRTLFCLTEIEAYVGRLVPKYYFEFKY